MKKIFYFLASAIVALGAMACQNEVDENITPENTNEITFNVSFDESTRIAGTVADGKATFTFDGKGINGIGESVADSLYVGYSNFNGESYDTKRAALTNTEDAPLTFTADQKNMSILNELVGVENVYAVNRNNEAVDSELGANGLLFRSEIFEVVAGENNITLSLACPALYFTVPAETTVALTAGSFEKEFTEGNHWVAISPNIFNKTIAISYSIGGEVMKEKTLTNLTNKVYNLGTLGTVMTIADVAELIDNAEAGSTITLPAGATITGSETPLTIDQNITINGNGATLRSTAGRAINVSGEGVEVAISNLNIKCTGERGVNVIQNADRVTLTNVNITADNYAVNVASSAPDAEIIINGGEYNGLCTVNVNANNANVTITGATINSHSTSENESYAALMIGDYTGSTISVEESEIIISGTSKIAESVNKESHIFVDNTEVGIPNPVAKIVYGDYAYTFSTLEEALEYAKEGDTVILLADAVIAQEGEFKIDLNGHNLSLADGYKASENGGVWTVVVCVAKVEGIGYENLADALTYAGTTKVVTLLADATNVATACVINANGHKLTAAEGYIATKDGENIKVVELGEAIENWGIVGDHQGWDTANTDEMFLIPDTKTYVRRNITLGDGFKFYGKTTKIVIEEHPAVTTGEEGDYYLVPNSNWKEANARFAIYFFKDGGDTAWVSMKDDNGDGIYVANKPTGNFDKMIFCRMNPDVATNDWVNRWNQTGDLTIPTNGNNCFTVPSGSWDGATTTWSLHVPEIKDAWTEEVEQVTTYWIGKDSADDITTWVTRWSNNGGEYNITVPDTNKKYDIYFSKGDDQNWGFEIYFTVVESGTVLDTLK